MLLDDAAAGALLLPAVWPPKLGRDTIWALARASSRGHDWVGSSSSEQQSQRPDARLLASAWNFQVGVKGGREKA